MNSVHGEKWSWAEKVLVNNPAQVCGHPRKSARVTNQSDSQGAEDGDDLQAADVVAAVPARAGLVLDSDLRPRQGLDLPIQVGFSSR